MKLNKSVIDSSKNILSLEIAGRIRSGYLSPLESELNHLTKHHPVFLILDLTGIEGIDSTGIGMLIKTRTDVLQGGGNVVLMASPRVQSVIKLSGLENYFKTAATQSEAIELVNEPPEPATTSDTQEPTAEESQDEPT